MACELRSRVQFRAVLQAKAWDYFSESLAER